MTDKELIDAIALTSGWAGMNEYEKLNVPDFLEWYKVNTSFCFKEGKAIAQQVIEYLENGLDMINQYLEHIKSNTVTFSHRLQRLGM